MGIIRQKYNARLVSGKKRQEKVNPTMRVSRAISMMLHPFAVPVYATALLLLYDPTMSIMPLRVKLLFIIIITIVAFAIPALSFFLLRTINLVPGRAAEKHDNEAIRLVVIAMSYGACIAMLGNIMWGTIFYKLLVTAFFCSAVALAATLLSRISLHMIPMGVVTALFVLFAIAGIGSIIIPLALSILLSGVLASAQLYIGKHNPLQVAAGYILGFAVCIAVMYFTR